MRIGIFCDVVGIDLDHLKTLRRRDQLPLVGDAGSAFMANYPPYRNREWAQFTLDDAVRLRCMLDLMRDDGLPPSSASKAVFASIGHLDRPAVQTATAAHDQWIAAARYIDRTGMTGAGHYAGTLADIALAIEREHERGRENETSEEFFRLMLANVSRAARFVTARAKQLGVADDQQKESS